MIRTVRVEDAISVVEIMNQAIEERKNAYLSPFEAKQGSDWFERLKASALAFVVKTDTRGDVCGWGTLTPYRSGRDAFQRAVEITFYFERAARGLGWGKEMIEHLEQLSHTMGKHHLVAILLDDNVPSQRLLVKMGYEEWGNFRELAEFPDRNRGHMYMGKRLT
ncbi:MAG: GNAT family N-acetyltransferase [Cryomorphaceae bacterium]